MNNDTVATPSIGCLSVMWLWFAAFIAIAGIWSGDARLLWTALLVFLVSLLAGLISMMREAQEEVIAFSGRGDWTDV